MFPARYQHLDAARRRFGDRVDRFGPYLSQGDPLADAAVDGLHLLPKHERERLLTALLEQRPVDGAPEALHDLLREAGRIPFWVDFEKAERGGKVVFQHGALSAISLTFRSLAGSYRSPAGNKPLAFSGRLTEQAGRRMAETGRFVQQVCLPGGMRRGGRGFATTVKVRLMHATVRQMLQRSPRWNADGWGVPINQGDMAGTVLLFSLVLCDGLVQLGVRLTDRDRSDVQHLWRYVGHVMGVDHDLLCADQVEARTLWELIESTQGPADDDSRALAKALIDNPVNSAKTPEDRKKAERLVKFHHALARHLLGDAAADELGLPRSAWSLAVPALRRAISTLDRVTRRVPPLEGFILGRGMDYWDEAIGIGLDGPDASFAMPATVPRS